MTSAPNLQTPIRHLTGKQVEELLPGIEHQLELIDLSYRLLREGSCQTPATPEIEPRPGVFSHALPAYVADPETTSVKWISGSADNRQRHGIPYLSGLIIVNDSETGLPLAIMDSAAITSARTAAASARCVDAFAVNDWSNVGMVSQGVQFDAHVAALSELNPDATFNVFSRHPVEAGDRPISAVRELWQAIDGADVVITAMPLEDRLEPRVAFDCLKPAALVLPLDDDSSLAADVANRALEFYVDDHDDFLLRQATGRFSGWRQPDAEVPEAVLNRDEKGGVVLCANQGMGVLDALFARSVLDAAECSGTGSLLDR